MEVKFKKKKMSLPAIHIDRLIPHLECGPQRDWNYFPPQSHPAWWEGMKNLKLSSQAIS